MSMLNKLRARPALCWGLAAVAAVAVGVAWSYYWRVFYYLDARVNPLFVTLACVLAALGAVLAAGVLHYGVRDFAAKGRCASPPAGCSSSLPTRHADPR